MGKNKRNKAGKKETSGNGIRKGMNWKVVLYSIVGLECIALTFLMDWMFIIGAVVCIYLNQKELNKK